MAFRLWLEPAMVEQTARRAKIVDIAKTATVAELLAAFGTRLTDSDQIFRQSAIPELQRPVERSLKLEERSCLSIEELSFQQ